MAGLNAQLSLVCRGHLKTTFRHVISWLDIYANPTLSTCGVRVDLAWFQPTASGYCQFGLVVRAAENGNLSLSLQNHDESRISEKQSR